MLSQARFVSVTDKEKATERRIRSDQLKIRSLGQVFRLEPTTIFLIDTISNETIFPDDDGVFNIDLFRDDFFIEGQRTNSNSSENPLTSFQTPPRPAFPRHIPGASPVPVPPPIARHNIDKRHNLKFRRGQWDRLGRLQDLGRPVPKIVEILARDSDLSVTSLERLLADEIQRLDSTAEKIEFKIFRKDGSEVYNCEASRQRDYWLNQSRNGTTWYVALPPTTSVANPDDDLTDTTANRRVSQTEILAEFKRFKADLKKLNEEGLANIAEIANTIKMNVTSNSRNENISTLVLRLVTCGMCSMIMDKPGACITCGNIIGCLPCVERSHLALNEVRRADELGPIEPMCPLCRSESIPFRPIELHGFDEIAALCRQLR